MPVSIGKDGKAVTVTTDGAKERLDTNAKIVGGIGGATGQWHWETWTPSQSLPTTVFTDVYIVTNAGSFYGAIFHLSSDNILIRVEIDSVVVLDLDIDDLHDDFDLNFEEGDDDDGVPDKWTPGTTAPWLGEYEPKRWRLQPPEPMSFATSFKIQMKGSGSTRTLKRGISTWRETT